MSSFNFKKSKYKPKIIILLILITIFSFTSSKFSVSADDLEAYAIDASSSTGNYSVTLPVDDTTYNVRLEIVRMYDDGSYVYSGTDEVYYVSVTNADGSTNTDLSSYYKFVYGYNSDHSHPEVGLDLSNVPAGSTVTVQNILVEQYEEDAWGTPLWSNFSQTYIETYITDETESAKIVLIDDDVAMKPLIAGDLVSQSCKIIGEEDTSFDRVTTDTLLSLSGYTSYEGNDFLTYLLSAYNVVSLDEIHSTHIIGPIISQNIAERTTEEGAVTGVLSASEYSNGIPSYVGEFTSFFDGSIYNIGVAFNYIFDYKQNSSFVVPYTYSEETRLTIDLKGNINSLQDYYILTDGTEVVSANNTGYTETYQNDDFIDFSALEQALINSSMDILESGNAEDYDEFITFEFDTDGTVNGSEINVYEGGELFVTITSSNGAEYDGRDFASFVSVATYGNNTADGIRLTINIEESWTILDATHLQEVDMILPDDYDYYDNPYLLPTTINFACEYINPQTYYIDVDGDGETEQVVHSAMPYTLINGDEFTESYGEDGEYSEVGNKIIWNMPYVVTNSETGDNRLTVFERAHNIAGHIIAPQAEFWNYDAEGDWLGGNLNGSAIVKSFYSGIMEMHMWAYSGLAEKAVVYGVEALKTVNGTEPDTEYTFLLDVVYEADGSIPEGILNSNFPMEANSSIDDGEEGSVKFSSIAFSDVGTYSFILYEDTSMDSLTDNVTYDLTKYQVDITVGLSEESTAETTVYEITSVKKYKIADSDGNELDTPELLATNDDGLVFVFDNTTSTEGTVNINFIKQCSTGHVLSGAKFYVTEMTSATNESRPSGGYFESITSDEYGNIYIENLEKNTYYKIWEYEAPYGHIIAEGYWIIEIDEYGYLASITAMNGAQEIGSDMIIYNEHEESTYLDLTITKKNQMNSSLSDVDFTLQRVIIDSSGVPQVVANGYYEEYTTSDNGTFEIAHLEADHIYMLTETSTPVAHIEHTGYWLITVTGNATNPSADLTYTIIEYDENHNMVSQSSNNVIMNEKEEFVLPTTGGIGKEAVYILGITLMLTSFGLYKRVSIKDTNKKILKVRISK